MRKLIDSFVSRRRLVPPVSMESLSNLAELLREEQSFDPEMKGWLMVEINNSVWKDVVASIPYDRRILLLPKCLSNSVKCEASVDELGLLCHRCNHCSIPDLQDKAEGLGMMSLVAEGFTSVIELIRNRVVDTVIGVSCLDSLEKAFPLLVDHAVPGLAIPLNKDGCKDTTVDYAYVERLISTYSGQRAGLLDYDYLQTSLRDWFTSQNLIRVMTPANDHTSAVAHEWLGGDGKRWRPYLLAAVYLALSGAETIPDEVQLTAIAVECFHKASLVHDDIQDNDLERYGKQTVNAAHGIPVAINVGDILLGEGYRLLTKTNDMELLKVAADAHITLCKGQGMELEWSLHPRELTVDFLLEIFRNKTVPAFEVSLVMGLICAGDDENLRNVFHNYSTALGIAYQLFDDLDDFETDAPVAFRPSAVLAVLCEQAPTGGFTTALLQTEDVKAFLYQPENKDALTAAIGDVRRLAERYREEAIGVLDEITNVELKRLLFRVTKRILN